MKLHKNRNQKKNIQHQRRKQRTNTAIKAKAYDARVLVSKSLLYISAQVIDKDGNVVASITDKGMAGDTKSARAHEAGKTLAAAIQKIGSEKVVFDRNGNLYHGRIKAFADGLRD